MSSNASTASRRAARIKQIREKQHRAITPRSSASGGTSSIGSTSSADAAAAPSSALSAADDSVGSRGAASGGGVVVDVGSAMLSSPSSSSGGNGGGGKGGGNDGGGDASSVASSRSRTRGQRAAAYRARKAAKAAASSTAASSLHHHPPVHPPTAGGGGSNGTSSSSSRRAPSPSPQMQINSVMSSASDVMSTTSHHTTSSQMTAKAANTPQRRGRSSAHRPSASSSSSDARGAGRSSSRTRARSASPAPRASASASSGRSASPSPSPARPTGGSRSANLRKLRSENPALLPTSTSTTTSSSGRSRSHSVSSNRSSRSRSVEPSGRYGRQEAPPTPPTPVDTVQVTAHEQPGGADPTSDIESCGVASPSSPMSASSSKSEHLSVEKGIRLIQKMDTSVQNASPSPRSTAKGRAPSPFRRHNNDAASTAPSSSPGPSSRPDPPRESSRKTAWDRAQKAVEAQMDSQEVERAPPMEPEEVKEVPPPSPRQPPTPTRTSRHQPGGAAADAMLLSPEQEEARLQAEEEIRHLEARASVMKQQMERQAEILVRQEEAMMQPSDPTAVYGQDYLPPNVPPTPQFSQFDYNDPTAPHPPQPSFQQPSVPAPPLPNNPYPHGVAPAVGMNAPVPPYHSSSPSPSYAAAPAPANSSPIMHPQPAPVYHHQQQVYSMQQQQQQYSAPMPQDSGMYYQGQPPQLQVNPIESFRAQEQQSKYREYTLSPPNQQQGASNGSSPYRPPPQAQYYQQQGGTYPSAQQGGVGFTAEPIVSHMHLQSHSETFTHEQTNSNAGMQYNQQQQQRETIQSMALNSNMQQQAAYYYGNAGPREGSEANMSEPSFDPSSISHLTQSTIASHPHPHEQPQQQPQEEPLRPARDPPATSGTPGQQAQSPRPVAPVLSPDAFKAAGTNGFGSDSDSDFDNPTFSPQSADNKSTPSVGSKAISETEKSGTSWWKDPFPEDSPGPDGSNKPKQLQSVAESDLDDAGFPLSETVPPPPPATNQPPAVATSMMPPSPGHHPVRSPSPTMNSVASGHASHFTAASVATADSLGRRLAAKLNINPDDDEDVFSGLEDGTVLPSAAAARPSPKPVAVTRGELPNEDIFDGVASPVASPAASRPDASSKAASSGNLGEARSLAMASNAVTDSESKGTTGLNTVEGPKALMDDATSFAGSASLIASKRSAANTSGQNAHSLNLDYSASTRDTGAAAAKIENVGAPGAPAAGLNEPTTAGVLGMEKEGLNEPNSTGVLGLDYGSTKQNQFVMNGENNQNILEFEDAGTVTSDITSSIIDTGPSARKEAYEAYAAAATTPSAKYEPILEGDAESKSKVSNEYEDEDTFDPDVNTIDNTVDDTYDNTLDHTLDTAESRRHGDRKARRKGNDKKGRKSRRHYDSDSFSEGTDTYDDITRGGSTVMTSTSGASSGSRPIDFFSRFGCGVLDSIATQCAGHGPRPHSFDDRSLEDGDLYNEEEGGRGGGGQSFDRTLDNSTLNGTLGTGTVTDTDNGGLSRKVGGLQRLFLFVPCIH